MSDSETHILRDLLLLADLKVSLVDIREWSGWQKEAAEKWAVAVHLQASDNDDVVRVPAKPGFLKKYSPPSRRGADQARQQIWRDEARR